MGPQDAETLLAKLRESRLSTDERRTALDALRQTLEALAANTLTNITKAAIHDGPNDVRRVAFQTLVLRIDADLFEHVADGSVASTVSDLIEAIEAFLRTTLKIQFSRTLSTSSRTMSDVQNLPNSALRAIAAALKTLHALIRVAPRKTRSDALTAESTSKATSLISLFDVILPCLSAGIQIGRLPTTSIPRSSSSLQAGAFSWTDASRQARTPPARNSPPPSAFVVSSSSNHNAEHLDHSSAGETDRKSDKSESERSDFSTASNATSSARSRKDETRQQEVTTKLIRQNALHCLVELNKHEARALISRWSDLLPDQPAHSFVPDRSIKQTSASSRLSPSASASAPFSLCTLIAQDPSTSVRLAAMAAIGSILSHGTLQLSMAQERAQRALSFTSLSSQLAGWIVNVRSYLVAALQRAAAAPRASARAEGSAEVVGYPSSLTLALLQLTQTFVTSTAKAKLVSPNASVLGPAVMSFASHSDPQVQTAAKWLIKTLTPPSPKPAVGLAVDVRRTKGVSSSSSTAIAASRAGDIATPLQTLSASDAASMDLRQLLGEGVEPTTEACEHALTALESADDLLRQLPSWSIFLKSLADAPTYLLRPETSARLVSVWQRLCVQQDKTPDQQCAVLSAVPDFCRAILRHSSLDTDTSISTLKYVECCCTDSDEAVRAAAVRVLGLLVLPSESVIVATDEHHQRTSQVLAAILWSDSNKTGTGAGALHDSSSLVRQRASWAFSNATEARLRSRTLVDGHEWISHARYCLEAGRDIEGVAVSACRASGILLALLTPADASSETCCSLSRSLLEQLCRVLGTTSKPPKSRWNAASALDRALGSTVVLTKVLDPSGASGDGLTDRVVELLCSNLDAKVFKIRLSAANALLSLCTGAEDAQLSRADAKRLELLGEQRTGRIRRVALARSAELDQPAQSKESALYSDELNRLLGKLIASTTSSSSF